MPGRSIKQVTVIGAVAFSGFIAGCGSGAEPTASPAAAPTRSPAAPASSSPTASSPPATPLPRATPLPKAKNGTKLRACRDARCEVLVSDGQTIKLNDTWGLWPVKVTVEDDSVTFSTGTASGMQVTMSEQTPDQGGPSTVDGLDFEVLAVQGKKAVIRITH
ncbi:hypothetical protein ACIBQX_35920 [Nonomuraea sp. NPDC049714]|uniref:hypothetical protein n=1 Tax=Nonomuraea sp. NPDC049714 TaxID=3364357 RepID=UPI0037A1CC8E